MIFVWDSEVLWRISSHMYQISFPQRPIQYSIYPPWSAVTYRICLPRSCVTYGIRLPRSPAKFVILDQPSPTEFVFLYRLILFWINHPRSAITTQGLHAKSKVGNSRLMSLNSILYFDWKTSQSLACIRSCRGFLSSYSFSLNCVKW